MIPKTSLKFFEEMMLCASPSGFETEVAKCFRTELESFCHEVHTDVLGNTVGVLNPQAPFKVMLAGHYDEIGYQVVYIDDNGLIYFRANGGIDKLNVPSSEVDILTANGRIPGVIGKKPIHLLKPEERNKALELTDMWIDIGCESREETEKLVAIGDPIANRGNFKILGKNRVMSKGLDDKIGAFVVAETLRELSKRQINVGVYGVGTVQEEVGLRGSRVSAYGINPNVGFALDVGFATDIPDIPKTRLGAISLGGGPEIHRNCDNNEVLGRTMRAIAKKHEIKVQETANHSATGGTDTSAIQMTRAGVATALISIPNRYMHSQVEMCDLRDIEGAVALLVETIASFTGEENFRPGLD